MLENDFYNLLEQLTVESRSLWRIENCYLEDAKKSGNPESLEFWQALAQDKEQHVADLKKIVKDRI